VISLRFWLDAYRAKAGRPLFCFIHRVFERLCGLGHDGGLLLASGNILGFEEVRSRDHDHLQKKKKRKAGDRISRFGAASHGGETVFVIHYIIEQTEKERSEFE